MIVLRGYGKRSAATNHCASPPKVSFLYRDAYTFNARDDEQTRTF